MVKNTSFAKQTSVFLFLQVYSRRPSNYEAFIDDKTEWISDRFFTQQRLAGVNPMSLRRVTLEAGKTFFFILSIVTLIVKLLLFQVTGQHC